MSCVDARDRLTELALGLLPPEDARDVERHLGSCHGCAKELAELQEGMASIAVSIPQAAPPEGLEDRVVDRVMASAGTKRRSGRRLGGRILAVVALAAAMIAGGALQWGLTQKRQAETQQHRVERVLRQQNGLADLVALLRKEFRGQGTLYQASLFPGTGHQEAGTALIFSATKTSGFVLVHVESPLDTKAGPYTVSLVGPSGQSLEVGALARTNNGDYVLYQDSIKQNISRSDPVELSHVSTLTVQDRFGTPVMNGTVHPFVESPPTP